MIGMGMSKEDGARRNRLQLSQPIGAAVDHDTRAPALNQQGTMAPMASRSDLDLAPCAEKCELDGSDLQFLKEAQGYHLCLLDRDLLLILLRCASSAILRSGRHSECRLDLSASTRRAPEKSVEGSMRRSKDSIISSPSLLLLALDRQHAVENLTSLLSSCGKLGGDLVFWSFSAMSTAGALPQAPLRQNGSVSKTGATSSGSGSDGNRQTGDRSPGVGVCAAIRQPRSRFSWLRILREF
jgi:hypothetical protein